MRRRSLAPRFLPRALVLALVCAAVLSSGLAPVHRADPVLAGTADTMESQILAWINDARKGHGLGSLRVDGRLADLAGDRATTLASKDQLSHDAAGCLTCQASARGITWDLLGEVLASNSWPWGGESARVVFDSWLNSPTHWNILMSPQMDTVGIGAALRSTNGVTYASAILIDAQGSVPATATAKPRPAATRAPAPAPAPAQTRAPKPAPTPAPTPEPRAELVTFSRTRLIAL